MISGALFVVLFVVAIAIVGWQAWKTPNVAPTREAIGDQPEPRLPDPGRKP